MEEAAGIAENSCCYGCLCRDDINPLHCYKVQNEALKAIFQTDTISFCYLCRRRAQQAELFIQNVQSNQILLENFHNITDSTLETIKNQTQPLTNLTHFPLDLIELGNNDETNEEESFSVINNSSKEIKIKLELKDEDNDFNLEGEYLGEDNDLDSYVKEEDEYPLKLLKEELELEGIKIKCLRKSVKKGRVKRKGTKEKKAKEDKIKDLKIETLYITREQCMEERTKMAADKKYINSVYKCEDCIKGFNFKASYDKHMEKHSESNGDYECDICKQRMGSEEKLHSHQRYHNLRYKCSECKLIRISRLTIKDHYTAFHCHGYHQYNCPHCSKTFKRQVSLRKHISYAHKHKERVQCAYCSKTYVSKEALKAHLIVRHPNEVSAGKVPKQHVCQECGMAFSAPSRLRNHSIKHTHRRDFYCVECDKSFKSDSILKHHLKTAMPHTNYLELPLPCLHCDKRFAIRRDLERHTNRVHLNIKPFQCDRCEKAYINPWSLNEHKRLIHEGYKRPLKYPCPMCDKVFDVSTQLCSQAYVEAHSLNQHKKLVHEGFKRPLKFPCPMCDKVFDRNQILKGHIRTHTGERPYQCSKCPAQFSQASILGTHVKLIHLKLTRDGRPKNSNAVK